MLDEALGQLLEWGIHEIQEYARKLGAPLVDYFMNKGVPVEDEDVPGPSPDGLATARPYRWRSAVEVNCNPEMYMSHCEGDNIRISINVFNDEADVGELISALDQ